MSKAGSRILKSVRKARALPRGKANGEGVVPAPEPVTRALSPDAVVDRESRKALLEAARKAGAAKAIPGPNAARSQDFLYRKGGR